MRGTAVDCHYLHRIKDGKLKLEILSCSERRERAAWGRKEPDVY